MSVVSPTSGQREASNRATGDRRVGNPRPPVPPHRVASNRVAAAERNERSSIYHDTSTITGKRGDLRDLNTMASKPPAGGRDLPMSPGELRSEKRRSSVADRLSMQGKPAKKPARLSTVASKANLGGVRTPKPSYSGPNSPAVAAAKDKAEKPEVRWDPKASLIAHSSAPLSSRVSVPPTSYSIPQQLRPTPLKGLDLDVQEKAIIGDLLFVFMGHEGQYITFASTYDPSAEADRLVGPTYQIAPGLDPSLKDMTQSMLKMATQYSALEAFVEVQSRAEFGAVNHALCATIRKLLKDYLILIAQLESQLLNNPSFTLHMLHLHVMPTSQSLAQLYALGQELLKRNSLLSQDEDESMVDFDDVDDILEQLREGGDLGPNSMSTKKMCKGGNVLGLLTQRLATFSGDPTTRKLLQMLLREASRPYMVMLNEWLHHGAIKDPHAEFLVKEQKGIKRDKLEEDYTDEYWDKRYTIREAEVPPQLETVRDKVLLAGKYLNVVRECGGVDISKEVMDVPKTFDDPLFLDNVNSAYAHANASLLHLLLTKNSLTTRFRSMKHYFFLDRADFFAYFLELGASELRKNVKNVNESKLQSLLDLVLRQPGSIAAQDPFKEDVKVRMNHMSLTKWLMRVVSVSGIDQDNPGTGLEKYQTSTSTSSSNDQEIIGFEALELDYMVPFPLSLVISRKTVLRYQLLFRYLLSLRHLESLLLNAWQDHVKVPCWRHKSSNQRLERWKQRAWTLRARMLIFVQQLLYFSTAEVIEPNWQSLMDRVNGNDAEGTEVIVNGTKQVDRTVDELMQDHVDFLDTCLKECMLTQSKLLKIHSKLMTCCAMFASWTASSLSRSLASADPDLTGDNANPDIPGADPSKPYDPTRMAKLNDTLKRYEDHFNRHLRILMDSLNYFAATESVVLLKLAHSLSTITKEG